MIRSIMFERHDEKNSQALNVTPNDEIHQNNNHIPKIVTKPETRNNNDIKPSLKFRRALPQILATCAKNLLLLTYGMTLGVSTIAIPALEDPNSSSKNGSHGYHQRDGILTLNETQISWFSSIHLICVPFGCFVSGLITQPLGRKKSMMLLNIPFFTVWLLLYNATSVTTLYIALVISGLSGGLHEAPVLTYLAEITQPSLRGMLGATAPTTVIIGTVSQLILGKFYHWRSVVLFNMFFPIIAFIALSFVPESPHWLIAKGRLEEAEKALCWLRGWVGPEMVKEEFSLLKKVIQSKSSRSRMSFMDKFKWYKRRTFIIPHFLLIVTFFVGHFGGMMSVQTNAVKLFTLLKSPIDEYTCTLILGITEFAGAVICVILVRWTGKRLLLIWTTAGCSISLLVVSLYAYVTSISTFTFDSSFSYIPLVFVNINAFLIHAGIRLLPWVLVGELYPTEIRATASGATAFWFYVFAFSANKSYQWMLSTLKVFGLLGLYGTVIGIGSVFFFFFLPETEGHTLHEIERHFAEEGNIFKTSIDSNHELGVTANDQKRMKEDIESYL
ncbi:facilitated trehalose transporter Tret1-like isoform X2 [Planococcus citri]|uniref:facilitated trehalose transporter Tret1-like isoform X2 n=1 Tax=Planococcus citri TaxID=170843 RepID=UPI0031F86E54